MNTLSMQACSVRFFGQICSILILSIFTTVALAERSIGNLPHEESFDADNYSDIVWVNTGLGATHTWVENGGWSGGAARFTPPLTNEGYSGLGQFVNLNGSAGSEQINVRFLIRHGSTWEEYATNSKIIILNRFLDNGSQGDRPMVISSQFNRWVTYGPCDGTVCNYQGGGWWPDGTDDFRIGNRPSNREQEWISVEIEANATLGIIKLYIYTLDGDLSGLYAQQTMATPGGRFSFVDIIGGYMSAAIQSDPDSYYMIDELKIDSQYIGPPTGFVVSVSKPPRELIAE